MAGPFRIVSLGRIAGWAPGSSIAYMTDLYQSRISLPVMNSTPSKLLI